MLKMLLDPMGGIVMTNDGNSILREEDVGDGTTSVIVLAGEFLALAEPLLDRQLHP